MPKINEYLPETEAQGQTSGIDPELTVVGRAGVNLEQFGSDVTQALRTVQQRQVQTETADAYQSVAQARADFTDQLQSQTRDGTLNTGDFQKQIQDWSDDQYQKYNTPDGRDYFTRQSARLSSSLTRSAANGQAQIAYKNGVVGYAQAQDAGVAAVTADPTQYHDVLSSSLEDLGNRISNGTLHEADRPGLQQDTEQKLAIGAIRGTYRDDPSKAEEMLKDPALAGILKPEQQQQMYKEVQSAKDSAETSQLQDINVQKALQKAKGDAFIAKNYGRMDSPDNPLKPQEIDAQVIAGNMTPEQGDTWKSSLKKSQTQMESDPIAVMNLRNRIYKQDSDPQQIKDQYQLMNQIGKGVSPTDVHAMLPLLDNSNQGKLLKQSESDLVQQAKVAYGLTGPMAPFHPQGYAQLQRFTQALDQAKSQMGAQGKPVMSLFDATPGNKDYFGNKINNFKTDMAAQNAQMQLGQNPPPKDIYTPMGIPQQAAPPPKGPIQRIQPGESLSDFLKRIGK